MLGVREGGREGVVSLAFQNHLIMSLSGEQFLSLVLALQSSTSILPRPEISSSSSRSSKSLSRCGGISSWKPFCNVRNCLSMPSLNRNCTYNLQRERKS